MRKDIEVKYLSLALLGLMNRVMVWYRRGGPLSPNQIGRLLSVLFLAGAAPVRSRSLPHVRSVSLVLQAVVVQQFAIENEGLIRSVRSTARCRPWDRRW